MTYDIRERAKRGAGGYEYRPVKMELNLGECLAWLKENTTPVDAYRNYSIMGPEREEYLYKINNWGVPYLEWTKP